jgi:hypothetical protein
MQIVRTLFEFSFGYVACNFARVCKCLPWIAKHFVDTHNYEACEAPGQKQKHKFAQKMFHGVLLPSRSQGFFNFFIGLVLPKGIDRPDHSWNPADHSELHHQAEKTCKWTTNRKEGQPRQEERNQKSHGWDVRIVLHRTQVSTGWLTTNLHWSLK